MPKNKSNKVLNNLHPKIHIYCEGNETERNYLQGYMSDHHKGNPLVQFVSIPKIRQNTPKSIITRIINDIDRESHLPCDRHWAVYDRESKSRIKDEDHLEALQIAKSHNISVAFSNVCIEQWFLYHFIYRLQYYILLLRT